MRGIPFEREKHFKDCLLTWKDAWWHREGHEEAEAEFMEAGDALVGEQDGKAVALALSCGGSFHHRDHKEELEICIISGITTAFHGRKSGFAGTLTAELLARSAEQGSALAGLSMFEQGFYNRLGFGNMPDRNETMLRPSDILTAGKISSPPVRLGPDDWKEIHACRAERYKCHGSLTGHPLMTRLEMGRQSFVLGFRNSQGRLTHHVQIGKIIGENGPAFTGWMAFSTPEQFRELMLLIKSLGDQIDMIRITELPGISLQTILRKPILFARETRKYPGRENGARNHSWTQCRILNLKKCINGMTCPGPEVSFNLSLNDPVEKFLDDSFTWKGCTGEYTVNFSENSSVENGHTPGLECLSCSVGTFTRLWNGSSTASNLRYTDTVKGSSNLLKALDRCLLLPEPDYDWEL
ncbi:hypothetical protein CSA37_08310 [Candidatus Fermentibacteria bacterium]|nr:MAG: hypothetical protein CSA37_08310 [Candidatus Fermentibacteria bacterium]